MASSREIKLEREFEKMRNALGNDQYCIQGSFDWKALYRYLGNGYNFEITRSDLCSGSAFKSFCAHVFVWVYNPNHIAERKSEFSKIETVESIRSVEALKTALDELVEKYSSNLPITA